MSSQADAPQAEQAGQAEPEQPRRLRDVVGGFLALGTATALGQIIGFVVLTMVARRVGPENLGSYTFVKSFTTYCEIPIDFGVTIYAIREMAQHPDRARSIAGEASLVQLGLLIVCTILTLLIAPAL